MKRFLSILSKSIFANLLPEDLFRSDVSMEVTRFLFSRYVSVVEIENHNYCNRTCWFCPNAQIDRRNTTTLLPECLFDKILDNLASIDYAQSLVWSRYHEPLAHESIFDRLRKARLQLPKAHLVLISNGDYLNRLTLKKLEETGVDRMMLDLYLPDGKERDLTVAKTELGKFSARTGLEVVGPLEGFDYRLKGSPICINMGIPCFTTRNISTRGGLVDVPSLVNYQRTATCFSPLHSLVIDYNGKCVLCCQTRSDATLHRNAIIGDLNAAGYSLFHFYRDLAPARSALVAPGPKNGVCKTCAVSANGPDRLGRRASWSKVASLIPGLPAAFDLGVRIGRRHRRFER